MQVNPNLSQIITQFHSGKKAIAAICITPLIIAKVLAQHNIKITLGDHDDLEKTVNDWGAEHIKCAQSDIICDKKNKNIINTSAYITLTQKLMMYIMG